MRWYVYLIVVTIIFIVSVLTPEEMYYASIGVNYTPISDKSIDESICLDKLCDDSLNKPNYINSLTLDPYCEYRSISDVKIIDWDNISLALYTMCWCTQNSWTCEYSIQNLGTKEQIERSYLN